MFAVWLYTIWSEHFQMLLILVLVYIPCYRRIRRFHTKMCLPKKKKRIHIFCAAFAFFDYFQKSLSLFRPHSPLQSGFSLFIFQIQIHFNNNERKRHTESTTIAYTLFRKYSYYYTIISYLNIWNNLYNWHLNGPMCRINVYVFCPPKFFMIVRRISRFLQISHSPRPLQRWSSGKRAGAERLASLLLTRKCIYLKCK